ncbi:MAG: hypothetical protein M3N08_02965, partial [Pseudomonadota bacterium]|nr:hypothetical protein [Pseudomonadota bacterium]
MIERLIAMVRPVPLFNANDIDRNFDLRDRNRGRATQQQGHVHELRVESGGSHIFAKVQGSAG